MHYKILVGHPLTRAETAEVEQLIQETFQEIHTTCNKWNPYSELSQLNQLKEQDPRPLSPLLYRLLRATDQVVRLSGGRFDPTIEPLQQLWKRYLEQGKKPAQREIARVAAAIGWQKIHFEGGVFFKEHADTALDLGGIAKGLCIDLLCERLHALGHTRLYVEWGGEIRTLGQHPDNRPWKIYVTKLGDDDPAHALKIYELEEGSIATSGDYLQQWLLQTKEGEYNKTLSYFHIFDPVTLQPLQSTRSSIASATVVADSCTFADGLATAAMLFPSLEEAKEWAQKMKEQFPFLDFYFYSRKTIDSSSQ
jgi:thiamine biosynthesis lipoprotein